MKSARFISLIYIVITGVLLTITGGCNNDDGVQRDLKPGTVSDIDGNIYATVIIGSQEWMAENLKTTRYNDGKSIELPGNNNKAWESNISGAYSWYNNDEANYKDKYGALYNWYAVSTGKLCPEGWRVPTDDEWTKANRYLASGKALSSTDDSTVNDTTSPGNPAGQTVESGFNITPGGARFSEIPGGTRKPAEGYFYYLDKSGRWWTSTELSPKGAWYRSAYTETPGIFRSHNFKETGLSVRCIR